MSTATPVAQRGFSRTLGAVLTDTSIKRSYIAGSGQYSEQKTPTDSIGQFSLTLTNVVVGSAIQLETVSGTVVSNGTASTSTVPLQVPTYAIGNPANDIVIKVRKGSASPYYRPYQTQVTTFLGAQTVFVSQIPDE